MAEIRNITQTRMTIGFYPQDLDLLDKLQRVIGGSSSELIRKYLREGGMRDLEQRVVINHAMAKQQKPEPVNVQPIPISRTPQISAEPTGSQYSPNTS